MENIIVLQFGSALKYETVARRRGGNGRFYACGGILQPSLNKLISMRFPESDDR